MSPRKLDLKRSLKKTNNELAALNRELATQMIVLASETGETGPLLQAVQTLRSVEKLYSVDDSPRESAEVQQALGDTLLKVGRQKEDKQAIEHAVQAYRGAITMASLLGDDKMRAELKKNYGIARSLLGKGHKTYSLFKVA